MNIPEAKFRPASVIAVDFDGTLVEHKYPKIGFPVPDATRVLLLLQERGHKIILYTMRSGKELEAAIGWMCERGLRPWAANDNPEQESWTKSRKVYAHLYIDDAALGCPLIRTNNGERPCVDWTAVEKQLRELGYL